MASTNEMDSLSTKLMMAILDQVLGVRILSALVHAFSRLHVVYSATQASACNRALLRELDKKDLTLVINGLDSAPRKNGEMCSHTTDRNFTSKNVDS